MLSLTHGLAFVHIYAHRQKAVEYGVPFVSKLKMMLVFMIHAGIYTSCWYRKYQHES